MDIPLLRSYLPSWKSSTTPHIGKNKFLADTSPVGLPGTNPIACREISTHLHPSEELLPAPLSSQRSC